MKLLIRSLVLVTCLLLNLAAPHTHAQAQDGTPELLDHIAAIKAAAALRSSFNFDAGDWDMESSEDVSRAYGPGVYQLRIETPTTVGWSTGPVRAVDFYVEVDTYHAGGPLNNEFGILFRNDGENYFLYSISSDGFFRLQKWLNGEWQTAAGASNRLGVLAQGDRFLLMVNDTPLAEARDATLAAGGAGVYAGTYEQGDLDVTLDNLDLWVLTQGVAGLPIDQQTLAAVQTRADEARQNSAGYNERFTRRSEDWTTGEDTAVMAGVQRGRLRIGVLEPQWFAWSQAELSAGDFLLEVDTAFADGGTPAEAGIVFRKQDDRNFYFVALDNTGRASIWKQTAGAWQVLAPWAKHDAIRTSAGAENRLGVLAEGTQVTTLINGQAVATIEDTAFTTGTLALAVGSFGQPGVEVTFDNVELWDLAGN